MYPDQPSPPSPNQYDFILNHQKRTPVDWLSSSSLPIRIGVVAGGLVILLILFAVVSSILSGSNNNNTQLVEVAQRQAELVRVASSVPQSATLTTQNLAATIKLTLSSDQRSLLVLLAQNNQTPDAKTLSARRSTATDTQLSASQQDGGYDSAFSGVIKQQITTYLQSVRQAYNTSTSASAHTTLQSVYDHGKLLSDLSTQKS